jgi:hypothetical protein
MFGAIEVGAIHGRLLTAWSAAGVAGPLIINLIADSQESAGKEGAALYELSLYIMVGVLVLGFMANLLVRRVGKQYHLRRKGRRSACEPPRKEEVDEHRGSPRCRRGAARGLLARTPGDHPLDAGQRGAALRSGEDGHRVGGAVRRLKRPAA